MGKKKKEEFVLKKEYFIYGVLGLVIILLSVFLINNIGKCRVYSLSTSNPKYRVANGVLVLTNQKNILKLSNIEYTGKEDNIVSVSLNLCVDMKKSCDSIATMSSNAAEGMSLKGYLEKISFDVNEASNKGLAITKKIKKRIVKELYLEVSIVTLDGESINDIVKIDVDKQYINNKMFY